MTSAEIIVEFVKGRPYTRNEIERVVNDGFKAPEVIPDMVAALVLDACMEVNDEERKGLDRVRGNGSVDWTEVVQAFKAAT
jgi:hypothetical protein